MPTLYCNGPRKIGFFQACWSRTTALKCPVLTPQGLFMKDDLLQLDQKEFLDASVEAALNVDAIISTYE